MSYRMGDGYDVERFQCEVKEDVFCSLCKNVSKDARLCQKSDHFFCFDHILRHLQYSKTCPVCRQKLTAETLRRPTGFIKSYLDGLIINCDYHARGCPESVRLDRLQSHVDQCAFAPVLCHDCRDVKVTLDQLKADQDRMEQRVDLILKQLNEVIENQNDLKSFLDAAKMHRDEILASVSEIKGSENEMNARHEQMKAAEEKEEVRGTITTAKRKQNWIGPTVKKLKSDVEQIKQSQVDMRAAMNAVEPRVLQQWDDVDD